MIQQIPKNEIKLENPPLNLEAELESSAMLTSSNDDEIVGPTCKIEPSSEDESPIIRKEDDLLEVRRYGKFLLRFYSRTQFLMFQQEMTEEEQFLKKPCVSLKRLTESSLETMKHNRRVHRKSFQCSVCGKLTNSESGLRIHVKNKHTARKHFECEFCRAKYFYKAAFESHKRKGCPCESPSSKANLGDPLS